jgi:hypothetical protein
MGDKERRCPALRDKKRGTPPPPKKVCLECEYACEFRGTRTFVKKPVEFSVQAVHLRLLQVCAADWLRMSEGKREFLLLNERFEAV